MQTIRSFAFILRKYTIYIVVIMFRLKFLSSVFLDGNANLIKCSGMDGFVEIAACILMRRKFSPLASH
jgi:hypothetical protein